MEQPLLFQAVVRYIGEYLEQDVSFLRPESRVATAIPGLDSIKLFEMTLHLEDRLGVEFDETVMEHVDTMQDLVDYVASRTSGVAETT